MKPVLIYRVPEKKCREEKNRNKWVKKSLLLYLLVSFGMIVALIYTLHPTTAPSKFPSFKNAQIMVIEEQKYSEEVLIFEQVKKLHGLLMGLGWLIFVPLGTFVGTFMRENHGWVSNKWFYIHTGFQFFGLLSTFTGFGLIAYHMKRIEASLHSILGLVILFLCSSQAFIGIIAQFQRNFEHKLGLFINRMYQYLGAITLLFGWIKCGIGLFIIGNSPGSNYLYLLFGALFVVMPFAISISSKVKYGRTAKHFSMFWFLTVSKNNLDWSGNFDGVSCIDH
jgi:hypothetical protein